MRCDGSIEVLRNGAKNFPRFNEMNFQKVLIVDYLLDVNVLLRALIHHS